MRKEGRIQNFVIALFGIAIVAMSIGFAAYATTLTIGGGSNGSNVSNATFKKAWDVHYDADSKQETVGADLGEITSADATNVTFTATLQKPGDTYTFTIPVVNDGTINANLSSITMSTLTAAQQNYIDYTIQFMGATYTVSNGSITGVTLAAGATQTMTVTVSYKSTATQAQLPEEDDVVNFYAALNFTDSAS